MSGLAQFKPVSFKGPLYLSAALVTDWCPSFFQVCPQADAGGMTLPSHCPSPAPRPHFQDFERTHRQLWKPQK